MPRVRGEAEEVNGEIHAEVNYHCAYEPMRSVRTQRWNYVKRFAETDMYMLCHTDDSPSKDALMSAGMTDMTAPREALYDLLFDPNETCNRARDEETKDVLQDMRNRLDQWMKDTDDPLLQGPIAPPEGASVNRPTDTSPSAAKDV